MLLLQPRNHALRTTKEDYAFNLKAADLIMNLGCIWYRAPKIFKCNTKKSNGLKVKASNMNNSYDNCQTFSVWTPVFCL